MLRIYLISIFPFCVFLSVAAQTTTWTSRATLPQYRQRGVGFSLGDKGYVIGGAVSATSAISGTATASMIIYDSQTDSWSSGPDFPGGAIYYPFVFVISNVAYVGDYGTNAFYAFDGTSWTRKANRPMPTPNCFYYPVCFQLNGIGYVGNGYNSNGPANLNTSVMYTYNPSTNTWDGGTLTNVPALNSSTVFLHGGKAYICGGHELSSNTNQNKLWEWDPATNTATQKTSHPYSYVLNTRGVSFATKGIIACGSGSYTRNDWYDFATDTWSTSTAVPTGASSAAYFTIGSDFYIAGGWGNGAFLLNTLQRGTTTLTPLPVNWLSFTGRPVHGAVELNWSTASEQNNTHFEVERSADALQFSKIGRVNSSTNPIVRNDYQYLDQSPIPARSFYRLKQVDLDGNFSYSSIIQINGELATGISTWVIPGANRLAVVIPQSLQGVSELFIYDATGRTLLRQQMLPGRSEINLSGVASGGVYFIKMIKGNAVFYTTQFIN
ncbi:MAG: hypothetical protein RL316_1028 [Bacteroidota bacterium]